MTKKNGLEGLGDFLGGLADSARENYLSGLDLAASLWEENLKVAGSRIEGWFAIQHDYLNLIRELSEKLPKETLGAWNGNPKALNNHIDRLLAFQQDYIKFMTGASERFTKEVTRLTKSAIERNFSLFKDYINLLRG